MDLGRRVRPNRVAAQAFRPDISAKNRPLAAHDCVDSTAISAPRHCEARSDEAIHLSLCGEMNRFAEPAIGRALARPVGSQ
jgi:hypothetical protein